MSRQSGFYCAVHPWLEREGLVKVGFTTNLARRLIDDCYTTCFSVGEWHYLFTLETPTGDEAHAIETGVLHACRHYRLAPRELLRLAPETIRAVAEAVAGKLRIAAVVKVRPAYAAAPREAGRGRGPEEVSREEAASRIHAAIEQLTVAPAAAGLAPPVEGLDDLVDDILSWTLVAAEQPAQPSRGEPQGEPQGSAGAPEPAPEPARQPGFFGRLGGKLTSIFLGDAAADADQAAGAFDDELDAGAEVVSALEAGSPYDYKAAPVPVALRDYQAVAAMSCLAELRATGRAILQMACRCGKTPIAYEVMRGLLQDQRGSAASALYLVPGLSLLRQTAQKLVSYGLDWPLLLVGSDPRQVEVPGGRQLAMTTDPRAVEAFMAAGGRRVVVSTYQSSGLVAGKPWALVVFDEAHRVCGGEAPRPFNGVVQEPRTGARLFMTATPVYDPPARTPLTMKDKQVFGGVAYRYHLRQGIAAGHVNDFRLEIVAAAAPAPEPGPAGAAQAAEEAAAPHQIAVAMARVDKLLVFCRNIAHAARLGEALAAVAPKQARPFEVFAVHSRMNPEQAAAALRRFAAPGVRGALLNVRMFQEGVEIPALNGVFFAAPRHSFRDIIQSLCRMLNAQPGKPQSVVFLPVLHAPGLAPSDPANLRRYAAIVPFVDALLEEDPRLYEHLLDPAEHPYPIELLETAALGPLGVRRDQLMQALRRTVRYGASAAARPVERLLRAENIPWQVGFDALRRVVVECKRYPKTTDLIEVGEAKANLHTIYRRYAEHYRRAQAGQESMLEPYQRRALESLEKWDPCGLEGPYPWATCMLFLEQWLDEHQGVMPMVCLTNGGYVGLDASAMERLSGVLTCCNQGDGKARKNSADPRRGFTISSEKQADMDRICGKHGLTWRKARDADGNLVPGAPKTCIQEAHRRFKDYYAANGPEGEYIRTWFSGYPAKHAKMEADGVDKTMVPLRKPAKGRKFPRPRRPAG